MRRTIARAIPCSVAVLWFVLALPLGVLPLTLSLEQAIDLGLKENPSIRIAEQQIVAAKGQVVSARGGLLPQLTLSGSYMRVGNLGNFALGSEYYLPVLDTASGQPTGTPYVVPQYEFSITSDREGTLESAQVGLSWPVFTGGRTWNAYRIATLSREAAEQSLRQARLSLILSIKEAFYGILLADAAVKVTEEAVTLTEAHVKRVEALYENGMVSKFDRLRADVQLANLQPALIKARNARELARKALLTVLNRDPATPLETPGELRATPEEVSLEPMILEALKTRPELRELELHRGMAARALSIAKAGYLPSIALVADYGKSRGQNFPPQDKEWQTSWDVGVAGSIPLFDGLTTLGKIREARANQEQLRLGEEQFRSAVRLEVTSGVLNLQAAGQTIQSQEKNVEEAEEALRIAQVRYENGQATNLDVLDAQVALTQARTNRLQALHDYLVAQARLEKAVGK
jgi:outer membrane protein TolC